MKMSPGPVWPEFVRIVTGGGEVGSAAAAPAVSAGVAIARSVAVIGRARVRRDAVSARRAARSRDMCISCISLR
jgi:hypothetical protein